MDAPALLRRLAQLGLWCLAASALVGVAAGLAAGVILAAVAVSGTELGEVQRSLWGAFARVVAVQALAPLGAWTAGAWWLLTLARPALDRRWRTLAPGLLALALVGFPPVGRFCFTAWDAGSAYEYAATWAWLSGGVAAALLLARRFTPGLRPGALAHPPGPPPQASAAGARPPA